MTEKEVVDFLKKNDEKGIAYFFLPDEVRDWINKDTIDFKKSELLIFTKFGDWVKFRDEDGIDLCDFDNFVFCLPTHYEIPLRGGWDEYDIKDGRFYEETRGLFYAWHEWSKCMSDNPRFTAFGGWQYPNCGAWYMNPKMLLGDAIDTHYADVLFQGEPAECMPATPCKIRFWKG